MDFSGIRSVYLIGIKGAGMTALAQVLHARGIAVFGSDTTAHYYTDDVLRAAGIPFVEGFDPANVPAAVDVVVRSTAYGEDHVEVVEALRRGMPVTTYPEAIAHICNTGRGIAVCGTHGKTTTAAMLGHVLVEAGLDPTVIVGGAVPQFGGNARAGRSDIVVVEADEYQNKFHALKPYGIVLTSIEYDHPDFFPTFDAYMDAFRVFLRSLPADGFLVACADDPIVQAVAGAAPCNVVWYGKSRGVPSDLHPQLLGDHNVQNALGILAAAERLGVPRDAALRAIASFQGTRRRFEIVGSVKHPVSDMSDSGEITVIDDYGHHPTEIRVTLAAACERYPGRRILCAFHAHTFTRTIALKDQFATAFVSADRTYVMDIFGSARERHGGITAEELAALISVHSSAVASGDVVHTVDALARDVQPGDVVICMGAGENDRVARMLVERLRVVRRTP